MSSNAAGFTTGNYAPTSAASRKVAIPRLQRPSHAQGASKDRRRVSRACTACRAHKIKCSGDKPECRHCTSTGRQCEYVLPRKDKLKIVTQRCVEMSSLLKKLRKCVDEEDNARITELLDAVDEDVSEMRQAPTPSNPDSDGDEDPRDLPDAGAASVPEQVADYLDLLDENLHENDRSRATGFVGKNSEVQWLRSVLNLDRDEDPAKASMPLRRGSNAPGTRGEQVSAVSFYLDCDNINLSLYDLDAQDMPDPETAERLLRVYMDKVHDSFQILPKRLFEDQFRKYFESIRHQKASRLNPKWQAILNLVFAIGAKHSHLADPSWQVDPRAHFIYQARARALGWNASTLTQHPDLPQIQVAGMLAFYYMAVGQVSRAWIVAGMALRFAYSLGLHVRNEDPSSSTAKKEVLVRIWWSLYFLERQLSIITGRPSVVVDSCCSVPLPLALAEDQVADDGDTVSRLRRPSSSSATFPVDISPTYSPSHQISWANLPPTPTGAGAAGANSGAYFKASVQMGIITQSILSSLYTAGTMIRSGGEIQQDIMHLSHRLDQWIASLPVDFNFQVRRSGVSTPTRVFFRERTLLAFQFCSAKILLTRPCLGGQWLPGKDGKDPTIPLSFFWKMSNVCVEAAKMEIDFLPDQANPSFMYEYGPWWCMVHQLMQALAVFLLALSYSSTSQQDCLMLASYAKKTIRWLRTMKDPLAQRAYRVAFKTFEVVANRMSLDVSDVWMEHSIAFPDEGVMMEMDSSMEMESFPTVAYSSVAIPTPFAGIPPVVPLTGSPAFSTLGPTPDASAFAPPSSFPMFSDSSYRREG